MFGKEILQGLVRALGYFLPPGTAKKAWSFQTAITEVPANTSAVVLNSKIEVATEGVLTGFAFFSSDYAGSGAQVLVNKSPIFLVAINHQPSPGLTEPMALNVLMGVGPYEITVIVENTTAAPINVAARVTGYQSPQALERDLEIRR